MTVSNEEPQVIQESEGGLKVECSSWSDEQEVGDLKEGESEIEEKKEEREKENEIEGEHEQKEEDTAKKEKAPVMQFENPNYSKK